MEFQRKWERAAFVAGGGNYQAPVNLVGAFLEDKVAANFGEVAPTYRPGTAFADLRACLPDFVCAGLKEGILQFGRRLAGFDNYDAVLTGVETRSSSPVRFLPRRNVREQYRGRISVRGGRRLCGRYHERGARQDSRSVRVIETSIKRGKMMSKFMERVAQSKHFTKWIDPASGVVSYILTSDMVPHTQSFYFTNRSITNDGRYLWVYCAFPPAGDANYGRSLAVVNLEKDTFTHFPETEF